MKPGKLISNRLKGLAQAAGLSQQDVAMRADLSLSLVAKLEQGKKADPRASTLLALAARASSRERSWMTWCGPGGRKSGGVERRRDAGLGDRQRQEEGEEAKEEVGKHPGFLAAPNRGRPHRREGLDHQHVS